MPDVSLLATLVATLAGFALGAVWYGPLFGKTWMRAVGTTAEALQRDFNPAGTYGATFVLGLIASYAFGLYLGPDPDARSRSQPGSGRSLPGCNGAGDELPVRAKPWCSSSSTAGIMLYGLR